MKLEFKVTELIAHDDRGGLYYIRENGVGPGWIGSYVNGQLRVKIGTDWPNQQAAITACSRHADQLMEECHD